MQQINAEGVTVLLTFANKQNTHYMSHPLYGDNPPKEPETTQKIFKVGDLVNHSSKPDKFIMTVFHNYKGNETGSIPEYLGMSGSIPIGWIGCRWISSQGKEQISWFDPSELIPSDSQS